MRNLVNKKFKVEWVETGDSGEVVVETYIRTGYLIDGVFIRELEKRTGKVIYTFEMFVKEIREQDHTQILYNTDNLTYINEDQGVECHITLFKTLGN